MEEAYLSEMLVSYHINIRRYKAEDHNSNLHRRENLKIWPNIIISGFFLIKILKNPFTENIALRKECLAVCTNIPAGHVNST